MAQQLRTKHKCGRCNDTKVVRVAVKYTRRHGGAYPEDDDEVEFSKVLSPEISHGDACEKFAYPEYVIEYAVCPCQHERRALAMLEAKDLPPAARFRNFEDFDPYPEKHQARDMAIQFLTSDFVYDERERNEQLQHKNGLIIAGPTGTGKSVLAGIVLRHRMASGDPCSILNFPVFTEQLRASYKDSYADTPITQVVDSYKRCKVLLIEDLGSKTRNDQQKILYADDIIDYVRIVIQYRLNAALPTLITTNLNGDGFLAQFGEVVKSRLDGLCHAVVMSGVDFRARVTIEE